MDKKLKLSAIAALGLVASTMGCSSKSCKSPQSSQVQNMMMQLDAEHQQMYNSMDCEGQNMAMKLANQSCKGQNSCKGQGSCASTTNSCAGQNSCKGMSQGPFTDKNKAVDVAMKMYQARMNATGQ